MPIFDEFCKICDIENKREIAKIEKLTKTILQKIVTVYEDTGEFRNYVLFDESNVIQDKETGEWYFELCASKKAEFLFFALKRYVMFNLEYALTLKSLNQMRIYTLLKQYEYRDDKKFKIALLELREILGLKPEEYPQYFVFRQNVLEVCRKEINETTDIEFDYVGIRGRGGRIAEIEFTIRKNPSVKEKKPNVIVEPCDGVSTPPINELELTHQPSVVRPSVETVPPRQTVSYVQPSKIEFDGYKFTLTGEPYFYIEEENEYYACICDNIFSEVQISDLIGIIEEYNPRRSLNNDYQEILGNALSREYKLLRSEIACRYGTHSQVKNIYKFFRKILENNLEKFIKESAKKLNEQ